MIVLIVAIPVIFNRAKKTAKGRYWIDKTMLLLPGMGILAKKLAVARFARTLGSLLENGVSMLIAMDIVKNIAGNILIADSVETAAIEVGKGQGLGAALSGSGIFPSLWKWGGDQHFTSYFIFGTCDDPGDGIDRRLYRFVDMPADIWNEPADSVGQ